MIPAHLSHLPADRRGLPVPFIAAWSSEHWDVARFDPIVNKWALFTAGRYGRGKPCFDVMNEPRQREVVMRGLCQVCNVRLERDPLTSRPVGVLPASVLNEGSQHDAEGRVVTAEPLLCRACGEYVVEHCCVLNKRGDPGLLIVMRWQPMLQIIDPSAAPPTHAYRFDKEGDLPRLGRIARHHGGLAGLVKVRIDETVPLIY